MIAITTSSSMRVKPRNRLLDMRNSFKKQMQSRKDGGKTAAAQAYWRLRDSTKLATNGRKQAVGFNSALVGQVVLRSRRKVLSFPFRYCQATRGCRVRWSR